MMIVLHGILITMMGFWSCVNGRGEIILLHLYRATFNRENENILNCIYNIFDRLKEISETNENMEQLEFYDMLKYGIISPHCYYTAKYKYKNIIFDTGSFYDSHIGSSRWCTISVPKKEWCMTYDGIEITNENPLPKEAKGDFKNIEYFRKELDEYEVVCEMSIQETKGFKYEWELCEYREEIERLLFPEIYRKYDK